MSSAPPSYDLAHIQDLVLAGQYQITGTALRGLGELGFDRTDLERCILGLSAADFHKTMPSEEMAGLMQDVYKPTFAGQPLYVKLQLVRLSRGQQHAVVISFKRK